MGELQLPEDGSVLIIDDNIDEAMPLINLLSKQGISSIYLSGKNSEMPENPLTKIRLAFIDIQLFGPSDPESYAQNIVRILDAIISKKNGPYIIIIWTTTAQINADVLKVKLKSIDNNPVEVFQLSKSSYIKTTMDEDLYIGLIKEIDAVLGKRFEQDDLNAVKDLVRNNIKVEAKIELVDDALKNISDELQDKLKRYDTFHLFTFWENLVRNASGEIVNSFSTLYPTDKYWQDNLKTGIYRLAHAQLEKTIDLVDDNELIRNALKTINQSFLDVVERDLTDTQNLSAKIRLDRNNITYTKKLAGDEYKIRKKNLTGKYQLLINGSRMPVGQLKDTKSIENLREWGRTPGQNTNICILIKEFKSITPEINTRLLIDFPRLKIRKPDNVYQIRGIHWKRKRNLLKSYYNPNAQILNKDNSGNYEIGDSEIKKFIFIELEITPLCDYMLGKWIKSRSLPGVLIPEEYTGNINEQSESIYSKIPLIIINKTRYKPVFNFHLLKSVDIEKDPNKLDRPIFRAKRELCNDIISRLSSHATRVGIVSVK